mmetsp:Transcript_103068/g.291961  ORF Transcript_103068/g.291961 Transcript_103068/m.291961 type:complete len:143 (+) Transcript_103068:64-492(+)
MSGAAEEDAPTSPTSPTSPDQPSALEDLEGGDAISDPTSAKAFVGGLMDAVVRIEVSDGRLITGQLWCFDQMKNIILLNCQETRPTAPGAEAEHRPLGPLVMVPGKHIVRIEAPRAQALAVVAQLQPKKKKPGQKPGPKPGQ